MSNSPKNRRNEILDAAETLFTTKGYTKTTINDILTMVGIAKGTFYHYFQSKEDVMNEVVMRFITNGVEAAKLIASNPNLNAHEKIFQIIMAQGSEESRKDQMIDELHQIDNAQMHQKSLIQTILQLTPILAGVIEQGIEEGLFKTPYPKETVEFLLVSSQFLFDEGIFEWEPQELMQKAMAFTHILETVLEAEKGSFSYMLSRLGKQDNLNQKGDERSE